MSPTKFLALTAFGVLALCRPVFAAAVPATTCTADTDCEHGFTCQVSTVVTTTSIACDAGDCAPSGTGGAARHDAQDGGAGSGTGGLTGTSGAAGSSGNAAGSTTVTSTCQPGPCTIDSDCGTGMVCHSETSETCSGSGSAPACPAGTKCDTSGVVSESECTTQTVSTCTYRWALPCNMDTDCGDGFVCQPSIGGECSGGSPVAGGAGGEADGGTTAPAKDLVADTCTTTMTYPGSCQAAVQGCAADTDCPSNWVCQVVTNGVVSTGGATGSDGTTGGVAATPNLKMCEAPYTATLGTKDGGGAGGRTGTTMSTSTGGTTGGTVGPPESTQGTGGAGGGTTNGTGPTGTAAGGASGAHDSSAPASTDNSSGCAVVATGTRSGAGAALAMLAGLALVVRRRRHSRL